MNARLTRSKCLERYLQTFRLERLRSDLFRSFQERADSGERFFEVEQLAEVVIGAAIQTLHAVVNAVSIRL